MSVTANDGTLELTNTDLIVDIPDIAALDNDAYIMARRNGLGASDSSILLGVNPYSTLQDLIKSKILTEVTAEERAVGDVPAVKKGKELEPLVVEKFIKAFGMPTIKPIAQYALKDFPYLKINYDGVTGTPEQYIPVEIKIVTKAGEKHYNCGKALFTERGGMRPLSDDVSNYDLTILQKAAFYGIPPYYYTQLQQQMLGLKAPYGYLTTLTESTWALTVYFVWRDLSTQSRLIVEGAEIWNNKILPLKQGIR